MGVLQVPELLLALLADVERVGAQRVLHAGFPSSPPSISEGVRSKDRLASGTVLDRAFAAPLAPRAPSTPLRRPLLDAVVHRHAHRYVLPCRMSRFSPAGYSFSANPERAPQPLPSRPCGQSPDPRTAPRVTQTAVRSSGSASRPVSRPGRRPSGRQGRILRQPRMCTADAGLPRRGQIPNLRTAPMTGAAVRSSGSCERKAHWRSKPCSRRGTPFAVAADAHAPVRPRPPRWPLRSESGGATGSGPTGHRPQPTVPAAEVDARHIPRVLRLTVRRHTTGLPAAPLAGVAGIGAVRAAAAMLQVRQSSD